MFCRHKWLLLIRWCTTVIWNNFQAWINNLMSLRLCCWECNAFFLPGFFWVFSLNIFLYLYLNILIAKVKKRVHCVKSVCIRSFPGPYFPAFGLNTERYGVSLRIYPECGKIWTRETPNMDTFHAVVIIEIISIFCHFWNWHPYFWIYDTSEEFMSSVTHEIQMFLSGHPIKQWGR